MRLKGSQTNSLQSRAERLDPPSQNPAGIYVDILKNPGALSGIETEWRDLCQRAPAHGFFQTFAWVWPWWKHLGEPCGYGLRIVTVRMDGRLVLVWPLVVRRQGLWRVGVWLGAGSGQYGDVVIEEGSDQGAWLEAAWDCIRTECGIDVLNLEGIRENAVVRRLLVQKLGKRKVVVTAPYVDITKWRDWAAFHAALKRGFRRNLVRARRRLSAQGHLRHRAINDPLEIERIISQSVRRKLDWLRERNIYGRLLERPEAEKWLIRTALAAHADGTLNMTALSVGDAIVATQIGFLHHRHYYSYFGSFDADYSSFKPGKVEIEDTFIWAFENRVETFDLMPPADDYKLDWPGFQATVEAFDGYPTAWGKIGKVWYGMGLRDKAIRVYGRLPRRFRRLAVRLFDT